MGIANRPESEAGFWDDEWEPRPLTDSHLASSRGRRHRLVNGVIWFTLSIMPAEVEFPEIVADPPHAIVKDGERPIPDIDEAVASLASAP